MSAFGLGWIVLPWLGALITALFLGRWIPLPQGHTRNTNIDGLRGHLATMVFVHHASIWWTYLHDGRWDAPPSALFDNLGLVGVELFFMITAYLFIGRLLDAAHPATGGARQIDWLKLYVSRVFRLTPVYLIAVTAVLITCLALTRWQRQEEWLPLLKSLAQWILFTVRGAPDLNGLSGTSIIVAQVTWTLPLEWAFYLALPLIYCVMVRKRPDTLVALTFLLALFAWVGHGKTKLLAAFVVGGLTAWLTRRVANQCARNTWGTLFFVVPLGCALTADFNQRHALQIFFLSVSFAAIALGADIGGVLQSRLSRQLGELAYGLYLLHGIVLFLMFTFVLGRQRSAAMNATEYGAFLGVVAPLVVLVAWVAHRWVEKPGMKLSEQGTAWVRNRLTQ